MHKYLVTKTFKGTLFSPQHPEGKELTFEAGSHMYGDLLDNSNLKIGECVIDDVKGLHLER